MTVTSPEEMPFNVNHTVRVRLTERGRDLLTKQNYVYKLTQEDLAVELWAAGCDIETAGFVARQLERKGLALAPAPNTTEIEASVTGAYEMPDGRTFWIDGPVAREIARRAAIALASSRAGGQDNA